MEHITSPDLTNYITRSLSKIKHKRFESYVVSRIIHTLNDFEIKFVTQQYVRLSNGKIALTDIFFPQLELHIEIDEGHHFEKKETQYLESSNDLSENLPKYIIVNQDKMREEDIISITNHNILRVNVFKDENGEQQSLASINEQIEKLVEFIQNSKQELLANNLFTPWNIITEFSPQTYIEQGSIKLNQNILFKKSMDACNCFGHSYRGFQKGGAKHINEPDTLIWFPTLFSNDQWENSISPDGNTIIEKSLDLNVMKIKVDEWNNGLKKRIVFAKVKHPLYRENMYRFLGLYQLQDTATIENGGIWKRISTEVKTYPPKNK